MASDSISDPDGSPDFRMAETRWTQVMRSKGETPEARLALKELAEAYYEPVHRFILDRSPNHDVARDLTQEFFSRVLDRYGFKGADPQKGRFRSFLLGAVKHFLSEHQAYLSRQKRGGGIPHQSLDAPPPGAPADTSAPGLQVADPAAMLPDDAFDRHWATTVLERALKRVEDSMAADGKEKQFEILQPWLAGGADEAQADAAMKLGLSGNATRVAIHRLRQKFKGAVRSELAQTVGPGIPVEEELQHLFAALGGAPSH